MIATSPGSPEVDSGSEPEQAVSKHSNAHREISLAILGVNIVIAWNRVNGAGPVLTSTRKYASDVPFSSVWTELKCG